MCTCSGRLLHFLAFYDQIFILSYSPGCAWLFDIIFIACLVTAFRPFHIVGFLLETSAVPPWLLWHWSFWVSLHLWDINLECFFVSSSLPCTSCHLIQCSIFYFSFIKSFHSVRHQWLKPSPHVEDQRQCSNPLLLKTCSVPTVSRIIPWTLTEQEIHEPWQMAESSPREGRKGKSEGVACANTKNLKARWCPWEMVAWPAPSSQGWRLQEWPR